MLLHTCIIVVHTTYVQILICNTRASTLSFGYTIRCLSRPSFASARGTSFTPSGMPWGFRLIAAQLQMLVAVWRRRALTCNRVSMRRQRWMRKRR